MKRSPVCGKPTCRFLRAGPQGEADGTASFPCEYPEEPATLKVTYKDEAENTTVKAPCLGSTNEPDAEPGNLCATRGSGIPKEPTDGEVKFIQFTTPFGEEFKSGTSLSSESDQGRVGMLLQFRTTKFNAAGTETIPTAIHFQAKGSWAVRAN